MNQSFMSIVIGSGLFVIIDLVRNKSSFVVCLALDFVIVFILSLSHSPSLFAQSLTSGQISIFFTNS